MAKVSVDRKDIEVTLTLSEDEALALLALVGRVEGGNQPIAFVYTALADAIENQVPSVWEYEVRCSASNVSAPTLKVVKRHG